MEVIEVIMLSACLAGINCKYNGGNNLHPSFKDLAKSENVVLVCPEELGGLSIPRSPCEIAGGSGEDVLNGQARVINKAGEDVSRYFVQGAQAVLELARTHQADLAILRRRSPSCGCGLIYDGSFTSTLRSGDGVCAALLKQHGIKVICDDDYLNKGVKE